MSGSKVVSLQATIARTTAALHERSAGRTIDEWVMAAGSSMSANGERHRELMRHHRDLIERELAARRRDNARSQSRIRGPDHHDGRPGDSGATGSRREPAAIPDLDVREAEARSPRRHPLDPALILMPPRQGDVVDLLQPVVDRVHGEPELKAGFAVSVGRLELLAESHANDRVREPEPILDGLATIRNHA